MFFHRVALCTGAILCGLSAFVIAQSWTLAGPNAADNARFEFTGDKKEKKKFVLPKLPGGAMPMWDLAVVEEKFIIHKGGILDRGVYFLVELKEDAANLGLGYKVHLIDSDGVKFANSTTFFDPSQGKKEDKVRLIFNGLNPKFNQAVWAKAVKVQFVNRAE